MGRGLNTQLGTAEESTYGTPVVVDRFHEIISESLERNQTTLQSQGLRAGARNVRRRGIISARMGSGDINMEVPTKGFGRFLEHLLGGTPTIAQQAATTAYLQTHELGDLVGKSLTIQKGVEENPGDALEPFTFHGCKLTQGTFSISVDQILQAALTVDAEDSENTTALAAASYTTPKLFHFMQGTLKVAGSSVAMVTDASVTIQNNLNTNRFYLSSSGLKKEPIDNDFPAVNGSLTAEFTDKTVFYDRFEGDDAVALVLEFVGDVIASTYYETFRITVPEVRFTGETPKVSGPDTVVATVPFDGHYDGTNPGVKVEYMSTDTAI